MCIKLDGVLSKPRQIWGGSPQGCVLANVLFCATIEELQTEELECETYHAEYNIIERSDAGPDLLPDFTLEFDQEDTTDYVLPFHENGYEPEVFFPSITSSPINLGECCEKAEKSSLDYTIYNQTGSVICRPNAGRNPARRIEEDEEEPAEVLCLEEMIELHGVPPRWEDIPLWFLKYIDDGLAGEKLPLSAASTHITHNKEKKMIHASKSEDFLKKTIQNAGKIGMKINAKKTKLLCINVTRNAHTNTFIKTNEFDQIEGAETLKLLGFTFGRRPDAAAHVEYITRKTYGKRWIIRHLQASGINEDKLVKIYSCYIRPTIEYASVTYHALLTEDLSNKIEDLQKESLKMIYGVKTSYKKCLEKANIETLKKRRENAVRVFANKNKNNPRVGQRWFAKNPNYEAGASTRKREECLVKKSNTERLKNGPLNTMRAILNGKL